MQGLVTSDELTYPRSFSSAPLVQMVSVCPSRSSLSLLHPSLCPRTLTSVDHINSLPFFLDFRGVQPGGGDGRRSEGTGEGGLVFTPWLQLCRALGASFRADHSTCWSPVSYSQVFSFPLTALSSRSFLPRSSSWSLLDPRMFPQPFGFPSPCQHLWKRSLH